jgi:hypothetical protein
VDFASITYKAPNQCKHTIVDPAVVPLFLDSGASVHISNDEADFFSLRPIAPRSVNGVGGLSIQAVGISTLRLVIARGIYITLDNMLFIPAAMVCLISVSALCEAHQCIASFDAANCWVQSCNGNCMLSGTLTSHCLYALSRGQLSAEHALWPTRSLPSNPGTVILDTPITTLSMILRAPVMQPVCLLIYLPFHLSVMLVSSENRHKLVFPRRLVMHGMQLIPWCTQR